MRRTQLYLDEGMWKELEIRARQSRCSVSELVRRALREKYLNDREKRAAVFESIIGLWKDRKDLPDTETYLRKLRQDDRWKRLIR